MASGLSARTRWLMVSAFTPVHRTSGGWGARFLAYRPGVYALILIALLAAVSILAPLLTPYGRDILDLDRILSPPAADHVLGTDELGRDLFSRLLFGGRFTLMVAFLSVLIATVIGITLGAAAGYFGGRVDLFVSGLVDLFLSVPVFLVIMVAASAAGGRLWAIPLIIGATSWMETARLVRSRFLSLRTEGFIEAARSLGTSNLDIVTRHMLPNSLPVIIVAMTVGFAQAMLIESALSFLGFGVQPPVPTWGNMLHNAHMLLRQAPAAAFAPGLMIFITSLSFNFAGRGFKAALAGERE